MEMKDMKRQLWYWMGWLLCMAGLLACQGCGDKLVVETMEMMEIHPDSHTLLPLEPDFSVRVKGDTLYNRYLCFRSGKEFPLLGFLRVDGKIYRFMEGDSLRIKPVESAACGEWCGKYSFLHPGKGWELPEYDDISWRDGKAGFGSANHEYPVNTPWCSGSIYVRRDINLNKDSLEGRKLYIKYICDDRMCLYWNGHLVLNRESYTPEPECICVSGSADFIRNGENVLAACCLDDGGMALLDYGLYAEDMRYKGVETAVLRKVDIGMTRTVYSLLCGEVELQIDFVSPSLLKEDDCLGCPVGFITYKVQATDGEQHDVEIMFDMDVYWMFGEVDVNSKVVDNWNVLQVGEDKKGLSSPEGGRRHLFIGLMADKMKHTQGEGHLLLQQNLTVDAPEGVLLLGYDNNVGVHYFGSMLLPYWNREGKYSVENKMREIGDKYKALQHECKRIDYYWNDILLQTDKKTDAERLVPFCREFMEGYHMISSVDGELLCLSDTVGCIESIYSHYPELLFFDRTDLLEGALKPVFDCYESEWWHKKYYPRDVGIYPIVQLQEKVEDNENEVNACLLEMVGAIKRYR